MSFIMYQTDKHGRKYAYRATSVWDPVRKMPISKREYLGRVNENGEIIPKRSVREAASSEQNKDRASSQQLESLQASVMELTEHIKLMDRKVDSLFNIIHGVTKVLNTDDM